jgi:quercetin dioxygenase-like cupin family protein
LPADVIADRKMSTHHMYCRFRQADDGDVRRGTSNNRPTGGARTTVDAMPYAIVDAVSVPTGHGPHPAASPYDRRISDALGVTAFEVYQVELPPDASTVPHDHLDDHHDDVYAITAGSGWLIVDGETTPVSPGQFISVDMHHVRHLHAGPRGLTLIAVCAESKLGRKIESSSART